MYAGFLQFQSIPEIGFAFHFSAESYQNYYETTENSFEIVYVSSGTILAELYGEKMVLSEGTIFVLFRRLPIMLTAFDGGFVSACTVQAAHDCDFTLLYGDEPPPSHDGVLLPFVTEPCAETEQIKKYLYSIASDIGASREQNGFSCALKVLHVMQTLDALAREKRNLGRNSASLLSFRIKDYIAQNIEKTITLQQIAKALQKTPNYLNSVFREANGITINQYIGKEKVKRIAELMQKQHLSFKTACENAAITDSSYGYRLFKKHMGVTPKTYLAGVHPPMK